MTKIWLTFHIFFSLVLFSVDDNFESVSQVGSTVSFFIGYIFIIVVIIFIIIIIVIIDYFQIEALNPITFVFLDWTKKTSCVAFRI